MKTLICLAVALSLAAGVGACRAQHKKTAAEYEAEADALLAKAAAQGAAPAPAGAAPAATSAVGGARQAANAPVAAPRTPAVPAAAGGGGLVAGRYTCIAGYGTMLTLGEMIISGGGYRFHAPTGADTTGSYAMTGAAIRWSGDIGAIKNSRITESGLDSHKPDFWFKFYAYDGARLPTTAACQKL